MPARDVDGEAAGFDKEMRDTVYWVALLRYVGCTGHAHEVATVFGDEIAIRAQTLVHDAANPAEVMRDVVAFATAGRSAGGTRADRPDDPADRQRVGGAQLLVRVRSRRHAGAAARLRPRRSRCVALHVRALERQRLSRPCAAARRSRWRCASCISATTWRRLAASSRRRRRSKPPAIVATAPTTRHSPTCSSRMDAAGSRGSPRWSRGTACSTSSRNHGARLTAPISTTHSRWRRTSST